MLTQLQTVKTRIGIEKADVRDDELLTRIIQFVSGWFEKDTNRVYEYSAEATEEFVADMMEFSVQRFPIVEIDSFELLVRQTDDWQEATGVDYIIRRQCVISLSFPIGTEKQQGRVNYSGGFILPGQDPVTDVSSLPTDLENAIIEQVVYFYRNRDRLGLSSVSGQTGSISFDPKSVAPLSWLPMAMQMVKKYERYVN